LVNILTVDVEDYLALFFRDVLGRERAISSRVVESTKRILDVLEQAKTCATFFCLGSVARQYPELIRDIHNRGFEVGSHGMNHLLYNRLGIKQIKEDLVAAKAILEDILGEMIRGFRAPRFSLGLDYPAVIESIVEAGYEYDSSIFPFSGSHCGSPGSPRGPYRIRTASGVLTEFPLATVRLAGRRFPVAGGGYLRHFPYKFNYWAVRSLNREGLPVTVYLHPYECDTVPLEYPRSGLSAKVRWRATRFNFLQYRGRSKTLKKIEALARDFTFSSISSVLAGGLKSQLSEISL